MFLLNKTCNILQQHLEKRVEKFGVSGYGWIGAIRILMVIIALVLSFRCGSRVGHSFIVNILMAFLFPGIYILWYIIGGCHEYYY